MGVGHRVLGLTNDRRFVCLLLLTLLTLFVPFTLPDNPGDRMTTSSGDQDLRGTNAIDSIDEAVDAVRASSPASFKNQQTLALRAQQLVSSKFRHGLSEVTWRDDWVLKLTQKLVDLYIKGRVALGGPDQELIVDGLLSPDRLMKRSKAYCSQQSIVLEAILQRLEIKYASVRFMGSPGHFAVAALTDGTWRYFDPDFRPRQQGMPLRDVVDGKMLLQMYSDSLASPAIALGFLEEAKRGEIRITNLNSYPANRGLMFNNITRLMSYWFFLIPLFLTIRRYFSIYKMTMRTFSDQQVLEAAGSS